MCDNVRALHWKRCWLKVKPHLNYQDQFVSLSNKESVGVQHPMTWPEHNDASIGQKVEMSKGKQGTYTLLQSHLQSHRKKPLTIWKLSD